ncbi:taste receptor type 2 member 3-like [Erinaceus europaeus]|uniref:Taste receptor type 2 n=1 Tax=Erinaceus europaeus TaxID=9365 RepID=A0ABM3XSF6_ERIEU|nr:taste receptor type 2 member 3-like [Erinaceus europaeus]
MLDLTSCVFFVLFVAEFILGMLGNGFIGWVNGRIWLMGQRLSLSDFVITLLILSRIILLCILFADSILVVLLSTVPAHDLGKQLFEIIWTFTNDLSIWLVTCLSVLYCLKIASFSHPAFLWLKWRVSRVVVWMLLGALLLSCASTMSLAYEFKIYSVLSDIDGTRNMTDHSRWKSYYELIHGIGILWNVPSLLVAVASSFLLILSLGRHTRQMQQNGSSSRDPSTEAHWRAIKIILSFPILFLLYFLALLLISSRPLLPETTTIEMTAKLIKMFYLFAHSFILILGQNKLKQIFLAMLRCQPGELTEFISS